MKQGKKRKILRRNGCRKKKFVLKEKKSGVFEGKANDKQEKYK